PRLQCTLHRASLCAIRSRFTAAAYQSCRCRTMKKPRLLDLFCGAGGASMGYYRAGFEVVGVDINPQPNYPFEFYHADAMETLSNFEEVPVIPTPVPHTAHWLTRFDVIAASQPCQDHSRLSKCYGAPVHGTGYMLHEVIEKLRKIAPCWIVENVEQADMPGAVTLCGATFGLGVSGLDLPRHRKFLSNIPLLVPPCSHRKGKTLGVYGNGTNKWHRE